MLPFASRGQLLATAPRELCLPGSAHGVAHSIDGVRLYSNGTLYFVQFEVPGSVYVIDSCNFERTLCLGCRWIVHGLDMRGRLIYSRPGRTGFWLHDLLTSAQTATVGQPWQVRDGQVLPCETSAGDYCELPDGSVLTPPGRGVVIYSRGWVALLVEEIIVILDLARRTILHVFDIVDPTTRLLGVDAQRLFLGVSGEVYYFRLNDFAMPNIVIKASYYLQSSSTGLVVTSTGQLCWLETTQPELAADANSTE